MKIACIGYLHGSGGAERQIVMLASALAERGHNVSLLVLAAFNSKYDIPNSVNVIDLTSIESRRENKIFLRYRALKKAYLSIEPDVTIHFWLQSAYLTAFMPKSVAGKLIYAERGDPGDAEYDGLLGIIRSIAFRRVDRFVFQSDGAKDFFGATISNRSVIIQNSVSVPENEFVLPCGKREKRILSVGRLHPQKNQLAFIEAFSEIAREFPEYIGEIYGDGELKSTLEKKITELNLTDRFFIRPSTGRIFEKMYSAELFVLTSNYEGMPNVLMEAMALGVPCISTDCKPGGARSLITDGENGIIVPIGDVDELGKAMKELLTNRNKADKMASAAQKIRITNSSKQIFDEWEQCVNSVCGK